MNQDACLAATGTGNDQQIAGRRRYRFPLSVIEAIDEVRDIQTYRRRAIGTTLYLLLQLFCAHEGREAYALQRSCVATRP